MLYAYNDTDDSIGSIDVYSNSSEAFKIAMASRLLYINVYNRGLELKKAYKILGRTVPEGEESHIFVGDTAREILFNW